MPNTSFITVSQQRVEQQLKRLLKNHSMQPGGPGQLQAAMHYAVLGGGKRVRPVLCYAAAQAVGSYCECADIPACAVELIHAYSLIHDDLPAMDDDSLRRGQPTCHIVFGEATAILAGDALQALAFELLSDASELSVGNNVRLQMISILSKASGKNGMVGGQAMDIAAAGTSLSETELSVMHSLKTGALIKASILLGALSTAVVSPSQLTSLTLYADCIGLAFQIKDDLLDVETDTLTLGKQQGKDASQNKPTYTSILGVSAAKAKLHALQSAALDALKNFDRRADELRALMEYVVERKY